MQSKWISQNLLSFRTVSIGAPGLLAIVAIAAILTSMTTGDEPSRLEAPPVKNAVKIQPSTSSVISAQPIDKEPQQTQLRGQTDPKQSNASTQGTSLASPQKTSPPQPTSDQRPSRPAPTSAKKSPGPRPDADPSVLTMKVFDPSTTKDVPEVPIRVAIVRDAPRFTVATSEAGIITDSSGKVLANLPSQNAVGVAWDAGGVRVGSLPSQSSLWIRPKTDRGLVFVNGRWYRGTVKIIPEQGALTAVNHVELQPYLYSVVGAEMYQSWPLHALKAQAIAARSYALVHIVRPASPHFDLGSTQRWQAYKGVNSEAGSTQSAVDKTRGIVISHQGGIVESLYASSSDLVREAHKGFGMSQYGARDLAQQNLDYRQILSRFYPGTELSLLQNQ